MRQNSPSGHRDAWSGHHLPSGVDSALRAHRQLHLGVDVVEIQPATPNLIQANEQERDVKSSDTGV